MEVAASTGHKTLQMLKRYTHLRAEDLQRECEVSKLGKLLESVRTTLSMFASMMLAW